VHRIALSVLALAAALVPAAAARADYVIEGRGFGHGVGMSQYGAYGYALREGRDFRWILGHYYPGTSIGRVATMRVRVVLRDARAPKVCSATAARDAGGRRIRLRDTRTYAFSALGAGKLRVTDTSNNRTRARLRAPVRVTGGVSTCIRGEAINGVRNGSYRGALRLHRREGRSVLVVNELGIESYLQGVVAAEMPSTWAAEALKAQAVVARSYALRGRVPDREYDLYPDVRSQVYRGIAGEDAAAIAAVRATRALAVRYGVQIAQTFFHSTSGGRTAGSEEGFGGGLPVPYLRPVDDPYDDISPVHTWTMRLTDRQMARKLRKVRLGDLQDVKVSATTDTGRVATVDVVGEEGAAQISGLELRRLLDLRSHWFAIRRDPGRPTR
jgi:stage II sporulation protein D